MKHRSTLPKIPSMIDLLRCFRHPIRLNAEFRLDLHGYEDPDEIQH